MGAGWGWLLATRAVNQAQRGRAQAAPWHRAKGAQSAPPRPRSEGPVVFRREEQERTRVREFPGVTHRRFRVVKKNPYPSIPQNSMTALPSLTRGATSY